MIGIVTNRSSILRKVIVMKERATKLVAKPKNIPSYTPKLEKTTKFLSFIPVHVTPFPLYPVSQTQVYDPSVFVHIAF